MISVQIQTAPFSLSDEEQKIRNIQADSGALVAFQGMVRGKDHAEKELTKLYLEHYPTVTENEIERIIHIAMKKWNITGCRVIHRVGDLKVGEPIVLVIVTAGHRKEAFLACEFIMDYLKTEAPFWKKECFTDGSEQWVEAKHSDNEAKQRWGL